MLSVDPAIIVYLSVINYPLLKTSMIPKFTWILPIQRAA